MMRPLALTALLAAGPVWADGVSLIGPTSGQLGGHPGGLYCSLDDCKTRDPAWHRGEQCSPFAHVCWTPIDSTTASCQWPTNGSGPICTVFGEVPPPPNEGGNVKKQCLVSGEIDKGWQNCADVK